MFFCSINNFIKFHKHKLVELHFNVKQDHMLLMLMDMSLCFFHLVLKQVNVLVVVIISIIRMQKICVPDVVKNLNVKVFNLMSRTNERRHIEWHETCKCECKFGANICNNKQRWNKDKCRCEFKYLIDKGMCDKGFIWNPSNSECECDKACDVGEYLDYNDYKCRKKIVDKLVDECAETVEEVKIAKITLVKNENKYKCNSSTLYIVLFSILFTINVGICIYLTYFYWYLKKDIPRVKFNTRLILKIEPIFLQQHN